MPPETAERQVKRRALHGIQQHAAALLRGGWRTSGQPTSLKDLHTQLKRFVAAVKGEEPVITPGEHGLIVNRMLEAIYGRRCRRRKLGSINLSLGDRHSKQPGTPGLLYLPRLTSFAEHDNRCHNLSMNAHRSPFIEIASTRRVECRRFTSEPQR